MTGTVKSVFIEVSHSVYGSAKGSAIEYDCVIIAYGSLLHHLFRCKNTGNYTINSDNLQSMINELSNQQYFSKNPGRKSFEFKVLRQRESNVRKLSSAEAYDTEEAKLCILYNHKSFDNNLYQYFNGYSEDKNKDYYNSDYVIPSSFVFLMTGNPSKEKFDNALYALLTSIKKTEIHPGMAIAVESTPFANMVFHNSLARGIVSKSFGPKREEFMIDAIIVQGCEGAPIFVFENGSKGTTIGVVVFVMPFNAENGFCLCLSLKHLLMGFFGLKADDYIPFNQHQLCNTSLSVDIGLLSSAVIFVRCHHKWGSGVVVDADLGLVLTCSHILYHDINKAYVVFKGRRYPAKVLFAAPPSEPYDLAVLQIGKIPGLRSLTMASESPVVGEQVMNVGYPLSTESAVAAIGIPTLSGGWVSKVSLSGGPLHTTSCAQSGMSGGAVLRPPNQLIGIVICNVCFGKSVFPFFCLAASVDDFRVAIANFIRTKNTYFLQSLINKSADVKMKWSLQESKL